MVDLAEPLGPWSISSLFTAPARTKLPEQPVERVLDLLLARDPPIRSPSVRSKSLKRRMGPAGWCSTGAVPKWSSTSRRYWAELRTWACGPCRNSSRYSSKERRLRSWRKSRLTTAPTSLRKSFALTFGCS
jgi:hypothetical protein